MNRDVKLNTDIILGSVVMFFSKTEQILSTPFEDTDYQSWRAF